MTSIKQEVQNYIIKNPKKLLKPELYEEVCRKFKISRKKASAYWCDLRDRNLVEDELELYPPVNLTQKEIKKIIKQNGENLDISVNVDHEVKTLEDLLSVCDVDSRLWEVISWQCKKWDLGIKNAEMRIETKQLYSVSAKFRPKKIDKDVQLQKDVILKELYEKSPVAKFTDVDKEIYSGDNLLELALFDVHFGKLAHSEETGEDYDLKIATKRYIDAVNDLIGRVNLESISRIMMPIGNDMINIDNIHNTTTAGTPQNTDSRFHKIVRTVKNLLIQTIERLTAIAPVDVVIVAGNHDEQTSFMIGEMLDAYFYHNEYVTVNNSAKPRKYYVWGTTSIMLTHGNKEKHAELGMIFAAENPELWAETTQRYIQLGHLHSNKKVRPIQNEEFQGFQIQIIPSISGTDAWHAGKGYMSLKQAKGFVYNRKDGLVAELTHTCKY